MGCVQAKPLEFEGSDYRGLDRFKMENGYVPSSDFVSHRRSTGQRPQPRENGEPRRHKVVDSGVDNDERQGLAVAVGGKGKRESVVHHSKKKQLNNCFDDEMVDGWPKWLVQNIPIQALAGLPPRSAESYKMIDKVFLSQLSLSLILS